MLRYLFGFLLVASAVCAQSWNDRAGDVSFDKAELEARIVGKSITFFDDGESLFADDGRYSYTYDGGATAYGKYQIKQDGVVCVDFDNGFARCDRFVMAGERLVLQTEKGERFPVRN